MIIDDNATRQPRLTAREWTVFILRAVVAMVVLVGAAAGLRHFFRAELESVSGDLLRALGPWGLFAGCFVAEALHFPTPPQVFMLAAMAAHVSTVDAMIPITLGSLLGGTASHVTGRWLARWQTPRRWLRVNLPGFDVVMNRYGLHAVVLACVSPFPFSTLCLLCGLERVRWGSVGVMLALRVPRLIVFQQLIALGWSA